MQEFAVKPDPDDPRLTHRVTGIDQEGTPIETSVVTERPLTLFLNGREIVTMMTIGDHPRYLAVGYLLNQNMLRPDDRIIGVDYDDEIETVVVRTERETDFEDKLKKKTLTSGCAQGTVFGDLMERFGEVRLDPAAVLRTSSMGVTSAAAALPARVAESSETRAPSRTRSAASRRTGVAATLPAAKRTWVSTLPLRSAASASTTLEMA